MNKLMNWTVGSFFRTIGRILAYLGIGLLIFLIFNNKINIKEIISSFSILKLNALENDYITLNYNDPYIINNHDSSFFGEEGILNKLKNTLDNELEGQAYAIFFSNDDIQVVYNVIDSNQNNFLGYNTLLSSDSFAITLSNFVPVCEAKIKRLSTYGSYSSLVSAILDDTSCTGSLGFIPLYQQDTLFDFRYETFNYFEYIFKYFILYDSNYLIKNNSVIEFNSINSEYVPSYYSIYGYDEPTILMRADSTVAYDVTFRVDSEHFGDNLGSFTLNFIDNVENVRFSSYEVYGLRKEDDKLYHLEQNTLVYLDYWNNNNGSDSDYCSWTDSSITCSLGTGDVVTDLSDISSITNIYSEIYIKFKFQNPVTYFTKSFNRTLNSPYVKDIYINDVCDNCLQIVQNTSINYALTFSSLSQNNYSNIVYSSIPDNGLFYLKPQFIDTSTDTYIIENTKVFDIYSHYGKLNKIDFSSNKLGGSTAIVFNLYSVGLNNIQDGTNGLQVLYYITPNVYYNYGTYSSDRFNYNYSYIDSNGDVNDSNLEGDYNNYEGDYPDIGNNFNIIKGIMGNDFYGLSGLILTPLDYIKQIPEKTCTPIVIPVPFTNSSFSLPCMSTIYDEYIPSLINIWHVIVYGLVSYAIGVNLFKTIKDTLEADTNNVEVLDL